MRRGILTLAFAWALVGGCASAQQQSLPTCEAQEHRAFDFWLGEWEVFENASGERTGTSSITLHDSGCVIQEEWRDFSGSYSGRSINLYDSTTGKWLQFWADATGEITRFEGGPTPDGGMRMVAMNEVRPGRTNPVAVGIEWTPRSDGSVRQHGIFSRDGGVTWADRYDYIYRRAEPRA